MYAYNIQERLNPPTPKTKTRFKIYGGILQRDGNVSIKSGLEESDECKMTRFLNGRVAYQAMKVEMQTKRCHTYQK